MKNILYIHGYGGSSNGRTTQLFNKYLDPTKYKLFSIDWDESDPEKSLVEIKNFIKTNNIDLVIGSSLGGFMAMQIRTHYRFIINPCYKPVQELKKLGVDCYDKYTNLQEQFHNNIDSEDRETCIGFFGNNDELFSYKTDFINDGFINYFDIDSGHHCSENAISGVIVPYIDRLFGEVISKNKEKFNSIYM